MIKQDKKLKQIHDEIGRLRFAEFLNSENISKQSKFSPTEFELPQKYFFYFYSVAVPFLWENFSLPV